MNKVAFIIGGSGYIGGFILKEFLKEGFFDKYFVYDIKPLNGFDNLIKDKKIQYVYSDIRVSIPVPKIELNSSESWIFNLAAIHREPGHGFREYFDTNIPGAKHVCNFAEILNVTNIFFTSSIAPYGKSTFVTTEESPLYPETGYGISKALGEEIHKKWLAKDEFNRRLVIVRPSVIYGPHDPGNVYRMIRALKKGVFILPNRGDVIKAYGYIYGLIDSIKFTMSRKNEKLIIYNYAENPLVTLKEMTIIAKRKLGYKKPTLYLPVPLLSFLALIIQAGVRMIGKKSDIHPVRVKKASFPTNIKAGYLIENGFEFKYGFENSLEHWLESAPEDLK